MISTITDSAILFVNQISICVVVWLNLCVISSKFALEMEKQMVNTLLAVIK